MRRWWTDIEAPDRPWTGLHLVLEGLRGAPPLHMESRRGPDLHMGARRLMHGEVARYYEGVRIERDLDVAAELAFDFPLPPIRAEDLRAAPAGLGRDWQRHWCRWVAERIDGHNFGYGGDWAIQVARLGTRPDHDWEARGPLVCDPELALDEPASIWKSWMLNGSSALLPLRAAKPAEHEGRVKHWRKQCRAGRMPPIVIWWISAFDCWLLVDGHRRLLAAQLEGQRPATIAVYSFVERHWPRSQESLEELERERGFRERDAALSPDAIRRLDQRLIQLFDDRPFWGPSTRAWVRGPKT